MSKGFIPATPNNFLFQLLINLHPFMKIEEPTFRSDALLKHLVVLWEKSVRATHFFLSELHIRQIATYVPVALQQIPHLLIVRDTADIPIAFMGIEGQKLEMLFISPEERGKGIGSKLLQHAVHHFSVHELCVNEQNPAARSFYEHNGFKVYKRTEFDEQGNPFPLLYMKRIK